MSPAYFAAIPAFLAAAWAASGLRSPGAPRPLLPASLRAVAVVAAVIVGIVPGAIAASSSSSSGQEVVTVDLGWAPSSNIPWNDITQIDLFNLATEAGPGLDTSNISNIDVPKWVATAHSHGVKTKIQIGGEGNNNWGTACNDTNRAQFVQNLIGFATTNGFDGVDLDIEDGPWSAIGPPAPAMTTCIQAISTAAHAKGLFVSADVITNWQGPWYAPSKDYVDQYQLMTFGDSLAQVQTNVQMTINQGLPASKFLVGIDVIDNPDPPAGGCGQFATYAAQAGLKGTFIWASRADSDHGNVCADALAGTSSSPPPPPPASAPAVSLTPSTLTFASQTVGSTSAAQSATLKNTGNAALTITGISLTGANAGDFARTTTCPLSPSTLAAGASCTVSTTFTPTAAGTRTASVSVTDNASGSPHQVALSGTGASTTPPPAGPAVSLTPSSLTFASQDVGTTSASQSATVKNTGTGPLTISSIALAGTNAADFARTTTCPTAPSTLAAGASCTVSVTFAPSASGGRTATLSILDNAAGSPQPLSLSGTGTTPAPPPSAAAVTLSSTSLSFGSQLVGSSSSAKSVTLTNSGTAALSISSVALTGANAGDFARTTTCGSTLAAGASCSFSVTFTPSAVGSRSASLTITDDASGSPHQVALSGTGSSAPAPAVTLSPTSLAFGSQTTGSTSAAKSVTLTNSGTAALTIAGIGLSGTNASDFAQSSTCPTNPNQLAIGASCTLSVTFSPSAAGSRSATLTVSDNAAGSPHTLALSGTGADLAPPSGPAVTLSATSLSFGSQQVGATTSAQSVTITNSGSAPLSISSLSLTGTNAADFGRTTTCPLSPSTLAAGTACALSVTFTPAAAGARSASLTIADNAAGSPQTVALDGTGTTGAPAVTMSPSSLSFGSQSIWSSSSARLVTLRNSGSAPLSFTRVALTGTNSADFVQTTTCPTSPATLGAGSACTVSVTFNPSAAGTRSARLTLTDNAATGQQSVPLSGTGTMFLSAARFGVWRPSTGTWYWSTGDSARLGATGDLPVPADYNGDGRLDVSVWRPPSPGTPYGTWYTAGNPGMAYGRAGDVPVPADYNGDGKADYGVWRPPSAGATSGTWFVGTSAGVPYGRAGDVPVPADYNGDGKADFAVWRPPSAGATYGTWFIGASSGIAYGRAGDVPVPADYNGDGKADLAVWRPSTSTWYVGTGGGSPYGRAGDVPVPADYNADHKADFAVWRPSTATWYISTDKGVPIGASGDVPISPAGAELGGTPSSSPAPGDTTPPSTPSGLATSAVGTTSVTLSWTASSDDVGVAGYGYYLNSAFVLNGTGTSYTFTGLTCGTSYTLAVDAFDAAGNRSARASVNVTTAACATGDTTPPSTPTGLATSGISQTSITLSWTASTDNVGVTGYGRYRNGTLLSTTNGTTFQFTGLSCGTTYTLGVDAVDGATNRSGRASITATTSACSSPPPTSSGQEVVTVDLGWAPASPSSIPWNDLTQIDLFNLATSAGPNLDTSNIANVNVPQWVATAHSHGVKAKIQIGGEGNNNWGIACNDTNRAQFVQNLINFATTNGFDGVDLDIEDGPWSAVGPPNPAMTTCIQAISAAAHAKGLFLSADVITNWQGPWHAPSQASVDQYQLMTFGRSLSQVQADVQQTISQGLPASKLLVGIDVIDNPDPPAGGCGQFADYAAQAGLKGAFIWAARADSDHGNACADGLAGASSTPPPPPPPGDTTPPSTPTGLVTSAIGQTSVTLSWTASTDNVGVTGYGRYRNGTLLSTATGTSFQFTGLTCGTTYTLGVDAVDAATNRSSQASVSASTSACSTSDTTPPSTPTGLATSAIGQTSITLSWTASTDNVGVTGYGRYRNGTLLSTATGTSFQFTGLTCGTTYTLGVDAVDAATNRSSQASVSASTSACSTPPPPSGGLHVSGNQLLDANNNSIQLHGVNYAGTEYACIQGWGIFDGPSDDAMVTAIKSWNANVVHIGLNEDCILGINGVAAAYSGSNYMNAIVAFVNRLHAQGLYAEVSLMWAAPGTQQALDHPAILDADHAGAALQAIANAFKGDPKTFIGLQSEPHAITWACWKNGGSSCSVGYTALGMQGALDAVRSTGATNVVTASGIDYANNLSQWLANKPNDSLNQLMAEAHVYGGNTCSSTACFDTNYAPVAASVPVVFGETGEMYDGSSCGSTNVSAIMNWADSHNVGYEAWVWDTWGNCSSLISDFNGTPANAYATYVKNHLATRP